MCSWFRFDKQQIVVKSKTHPVKWIPYERKTLTYSSDVDYVEYVFNGNLHKAYYSNGLLHGEPAVIIGDAKYSYKNGKKYKNNS